MFHQIVTQFIPNLHTNVAWTPLAIPLFLGAGLCLALAVMLLRRPLPDKERIGVLMLLSGAWYAITYAMEIISIDLNDKLLWNKIQYVGILLFPIASLAMGLLYTNRGHLITKKNVLRITSISFFFILFVFTTDFHKLFWHTISLNSQTIPQTLHVEYAVGFWLFIIYVSIVTLIGLGLMLSSFIKSRILHRRQIRILMTSLCVLVSAILLNAFDIGPASYIDLQPFAILWVCIAIGWYSYRLHISDIVPVAYLAVIEKIPDAVVILNTSHRILKLNLAAENFLGGSSHDLVGRPFSECCPDIDALIDDASGSQSTIELSLNKQGTIYTYEIQNSPILDGRDRLASQVIIIRDITNRIQVVREREQRHRYLRALWSSVPDAIVVLNADRTVREWSQGAERIFALPTNSALGKSFTSLTAFNSERGLDVESLLITIWRRNTINIVETQLCRQDGTVIDILVSGSPIIMNDELNGAVIVFTDISTLKKVEASLRQLNEELEQRVTDRTLSLTETNKKLAEEIARHQETEISLVQRNRELLSFQAAATATSSSLDMVFVLETLAWEMIDLLEMDGCCVFQLDTNKNELVAIADYASLIMNEPTPERRINLNEYVIYQRVINERYAKLLSKNDSPEYIEANQILLLPMVFQDRVVGLVELANDDPNREISERQIALGHSLANQAAIALENANLYRRAQQEILDRQRAEVQIKASLKEKEMLLQEIHHRVKNNLQVISSLLSLQSRNVTDEDILTVLRESQDRTRSMALIHEKLYRSENLARIDFASYLQSLTSHLVRSYRSSKGLARLQLDVEDVSLSLESAVPCGLIVNELVSNALKHAFADGREGTIFISLRKDNDSQVTLMVADDGIGFPEDFDIKQSDSLGLRLVTMLVGQVRGELKVTNELGAKFEVIFPGE